MEKYASYDVHPKIGSRRMRAAARVCIIWGYIVLVAGIWFGLTAPSFKADYYTENIYRLSALQITVSVLVSVILFTTAAVLKALADIAQEFRTARQMTARHLDEDI